MARGLCSHRDEAGEAGPHVMRGSQGGRGWHTCDDPPGTRVEAGGGRVRGLLAHPPNITLSNGQTQGP